MDILNITISLKERNEYAMDKLYIIVPAYNEEENVETFVKEWHPVTESLGAEAELAIINDGSKDSTYEKLTKLKDQYPNLTAIDKKNEGHGPTLLYGYQYALENGADFIFQTDSDGQTLPEEFAQFWEKRHDYDALIGHRSKRQDGAGRVFVSNVLKMILKIIFGVSVTDANTPFRLIKAEILKKHMDKIPEKFNLPNIMLTVLLLHSKDKVKFIPITFKPRQAGVNSINMPKIFKIGMQALKDFYAIKKSLKKQPKVR